jgi:hypothetical protein
MGLEYLKNLNDADSACSEIKLQQESEPWIGLNDQDLELSKPAVANSQLLFPERNMD